MWWDDSSLAVVKDRFADLPAYDWIIVDTNPSWSCWVDSLLKVSDAILIPVDFGVYAISGVSELLNRVDRSRGIGLLPVRYDLRNNRSIRPRILPQTKRGVVLPVAINNKYPLIPRGQIDAQVDGHRGSAHAPCSVMDRHDHKSTSAFCWLFFQSSKSPRGMRHALPAFTAPGNLPWRHQRFTESSDMRSSSAISCDVKYVASDKTATPP